MIILNFISGKDLSRKNLYRLFLTAEPLPVRGFFISMTFVSQLHYKDTKLF